MICGKPTARGRACRRRGAVCPEHGPMRAEPVADVDEPEFDEYTQRARALLTKSAIVVTMMHRVQRGEPLWPDEPELDAALRRELDMQGATT